eukprot:SAG22_NODE_1870_length_3401_cov_5.551484_1_plen_74_part_10
MSAASWTFHTHFAVKPVRTDREIYCDIRDRFQQRAAAEEAAAAGAAAGRPGRGGRGGGDDGDDGAEGSGGGVGG